MSSVGKRRPTLCRAAPHPEYARAGAGCAPAATFSAKTSRPKTWPKAGPSENPSAPIHIVRALMASTPWVTALSVLWTLISVLLSVRVHDWTWFERSGSVLTVAAVALTGRSIVRAGRAGIGPKSPFTIGAVAGSYINEQGRIMVRVQHSAETMARRREERRDDTAALVGFVLAVMGTVIWGYGDLLGKLFGKP